MYTRDETYYFTLISIRIQDCVFRVPRHVFEDQSEVFRDMFSMPSSGSSEEFLEGESDEIPIRLEGIDKQSFKIFLQVLCPPPGSTYFQKSSDGHQAGPSSNKNERLSKWITVLRLAHMWEFWRIRDLAIWNVQRLGLTLVQMIEIMHEFDIHGWYLSTYMALAKRDAPLSIEEANRLGFEFSIKMAGIREKWIADNSVSRHRRSSARGPDGLRPEEAVLRTNIIETFKLNTSHTTPEKPITPDRFSIFC